MGKRGRDRKLRFRRTRAEIETGLTPEKAQKLRCKRSTERKATVGEKVKLIEVLQSKIGIDIVNPSSKSVIPRYRINEKYADPQEVLQRIRMQAAKETAKDPLLVLRSQSS